MKNIFTKLTSLVLALALCIPLLACNITPDEQQNPDENTPTQTADAVTYVGIDINPSVELTLDENGVVCTVYGANEDGTVLLYGEEENLLGKGYEEAVEHITDLAVELGYLTEGHKISTTVSSEDASLEELISQKLDEKISAAADKHGFHVEITKEAGYELLRKLKEYKEKHPDDIEIQNLTPGKYKLALSASENGEVSIDVAVKMDNKELISKINDAHAKVEKYATDLYKEAKARAEMIYEIAMGVAVDGVYTGIYLNRLSSILTNPQYMNTFYYGAVYQAYKTTARTLGSLEEILEFGEEMTNYEVSEETVAQIATELGIEDTSVFADEDGKVTVKSVCKYTYRFLDQNDLDETVEERIEEILDELEEAAEMAALSSEAYAQDLESLKNKIEGIVNNINSQLSTFLSFIPEDAKAELEACLADLNATAENITLMMEGGLTEDELETLIENAEEKAEEMLEKINADLTEEEKARAEEFIAQAEATVKTLTEDFSSRLDAAEKEAKEHIERHREERKNAHK